MLFSLFKRLPWFRLKIEDGDEVSGEKQKNGDLFLDIHSGWSHTRLVLSEKNVRVLMAWLKLSYRGEQNGTVKILSLGGKPPVS